MHTATQRLGLASALGLAVLVCGTAMAQRTGSAFTATGESCSDITWQPSVLEQYPRIAEACQDVVQYDGRYFVQFDGTVQSVTGNGSRLVMRFEGLDENTTLNPPENARLFIAGRSTPFRDLTRGQELTIHVPADQFVAYFGEEPRPQVEVVAVQFVPVQETRVASAAGQPSRTLPSTAGMLPLLGVLGGGLLAIGGALLPFGRRPRS
jgi:hypothetical protein